MRQKKKMSPILQKEYLVFLLIPCIQVFACVQYIDGFDRVISYLLYILVNVVVTILMYRGIELLGAKYDLRRWQISVCLILGLVVVDQAIKGVLQYTGFESRVIGEWVMIKQVHNVNQTGLFNYFHIQLERIFVILFKVCTFAVLLCFYSKVKTKEARIAFLLLVAAQLSNLFDTLLRNATLDYIYFYKLICYDLKDYFVDAGLAAFLLSLWLRYQKEKQSVERRD